MNTRKFLVTVFVFALLALVVLSAGRAEARQQSALSVVSRNNANQVFYSPSIGSIVNLVSTTQITNQVFYSPSVKSFVDRAPATQFANQVFYSPAIESLVDRSLKAQIANQVFYSPTIQSFLH
jgi:hypothetical protein